MTARRLIVASDHGGFELKQLIAKHLRAMGHIVEDIGTHSPDSVDYPLFASALARDVASGKYELGILCCGTGIGVSIAANKIPGVRAALVSDTFSAQMSRAHNDANVLCLGGRVVGPGLALNIVDTWLATPFEGGRHQRRVEQLAELDSKTK